jgi:hypothetical protein
MQKFSLLFSLAAAVSGCISEDLETSEIESALSADGWTNDIQVPSQASPYQVGLATYANRLYMVYRPGGSSQLRTASFDGNSWSSYSTSNLQGDYGPALAATSTGLVTVYKSYGQNRLLMARGTGNGWGAPVQVGATLPSGSSYRYAPAVAVLGTTIHIAYCYRDQWGERAAVDRLENTTWRRLDTTYLTDSNCKSVALGRTGDGRLAFLFTTEYPGGILDSSVWRMYDSFVDTNGNVTSQRLLTMTSKKPASVATCGGITHMVHGGNASPDSIYWTHLVNGQWPQDAVVPSQASHGGAQVACLGTRAFMVHNGGYDQLWWSEYVPD